MKAILRRTFIGVAAAIAAPIGVPAAPQPPSPDAELLQLGEELARIWAEENAAWALVPDEEDEDGPLAIRASALTVVACEIVERLQHLRATTLTGLLIKVQAISWCQGGDVWAAEDLCLDHQAPTPVDRKILAGLLQDLTAMGRARV